MKSKIAWIIFIIFFMIIFFFFIVIPKILTERRLMYANRPLKNLKNFSLVMTTYLQKQKNKVYPKNFESLQNYYKHLYPQSYSIYRYFVSDDQKYFIYLVFPNSVANDIKVFFTDESNKIFQTSLQNQKDQEKFQNLDIRNINWSKEGENRIVLPGIFWSMLENE